MNFHPAGLMTDLGTTFRHLFGQDAESKAAEDVTRAVKATDFGRDDLQVSVAALKAATDDAARTAKKVEIAKAAIQDAPAAIKAAVKPPPGVPFTELSAGAGGVGFHQAFPTLAAADKQALDGAAAAVKALDMAKAADLYTTIAARQPDPIKKLAVAYMAAQNGAHDAAAQVLLDMRPDVVGEGPDAAIFIDFALNMRKFAPPGQGDAYAKLALDTYQSAIDHSRGHMDQWNMQVWVGNKPADRTLLANHALTWAGQLGPEDSALKQQLDSLGRNLLADVDKEQKHVEQVAKENATAFTPYTISPNAGGLNGANFVG